MGSGEKYESKIRVAHFYIPYITVGHSRVADFDIYVEKRIGHHSIFFRKLIHGNHLWIHILKKEKKGAIIFYIPKRISRVETVIVTPFGL